MRHQNESTVCSRHLSHSICAGLHQPLYRLSFCSRSWVRTTTFFFRALPEQHAFHVVLVSKFLRKRPENHSRAFSGLHFKFRVFVNRGPFFDPVGGGRYLLSLLHHVALRRGAFVPLSSLSLSAALSFRAFMHSFLYSFLGRRFFQRPSVLGTTYVSLSFVSFCLTLWRSILWSTCWAPHVFALFLFYFLRSPVP